MSKKYLSAKSAHFGFRLGMLFLLLILTDNLIGSTRQLVTYSVEMDEKKWDSFYISITIENNKNDQLLCMMPKHAPGIYSEEKYYEDISDLKVVGNVVQNIEARRISNNSWLINAAKNNLIIISYKIKRKTDSILGECIGRDFAWINSATMFMYIRELENVPINLVVSVPYGWKLATGLAAAIQDFEYSAINYDQLIQLPIYVGNFEEIFFRIRNGNGFVLIDGPDNFNAGKLPTIAKQVAAYQTYLLMSKPLEKYLFIFKIFPDQKEITSLAFQNSSIYYLPANSVKNDLNNVGKVIASNFFKRWFSPQFLMNSYKGSNLNFTQRTTLLWFFNGICDYYSCVSMIRGGFWSQEDIINHYMQLINKLRRHPNYLIPSVAELSCNIFEKDYKETNQILQMKGELLCLLMDLKIRDMTNNYKNFDDIVRFINNWFQNKHITFSDEDLLTTINSVSSVDLTTFFDLYVNGNIELPFDECFQAVGIMVDSKIDSIPDLGKISLDETNKVVQLARNGPLDLAGMKIGDQFLSLNEIKCRCKNQLNQIIDSLKVGSDVEITIRRENLSLIIGAKVSGKEVKVVSLKAIDNETDRQKLIRESWLTGRRLNLKKN